MPTGAFDDKFIILPDQYVRPDDPVSAPGVPAPDDSPGLADFAGDLDLVTETSDYERPSVPPEPPPV